MKPLRWTARILKGIYLFFRFLIFGVKQPTIYVTNPLGNKRRNLPCFCGSGIKTKKCCGMFPALPMDVAEKVQAAIKYEEQ